MTENTDRISKDDFLKDILIILGETFEGSPVGEGSAYLDQGVGVLITLDQISAEAASDKVNNTSIAAQTEHLKFYLDRLCEFIEGRTEKVNWEQSWLIESVEKDEWDALRSGVRSSYENVLRCIAGVNVWDQNNIGDLVAIIAHSAYHLGAIRQIMKTVGGPK